MNTDWMNIVHTVVVWVLSGCALSEGPMLICLCETPSGGGEAATDDEPAGF